MTGVGNPADLRRRAPCSMPVMFMDCPWCVVARPWRPC